MASVVFTRMVTPVARPSKLTVALVKAQEHAIYCMPKLVHMLNLSDGKYAGDI